MRQIIVALICLFITVNCQPIDYQWQAAVAGTGGDWDDPNPANVWLTADPVANGGAPTKPNHRAIFDSPSVGPVTLKSVKDIYGIDYNLADGEVITVSNNLTAHAINIQNAKFVIGKTGRALPHNDSSTISLPSSSSALLDVFGIVDTPIDLQYGNVSVEQGGFVSQLWVSGGYTFVHGQVDTIVVTGGGGVIQVWGHVKSITSPDTYSATIEVWGTVDHIAVYSATTTIYKGATVNYVDPYGGELHIYPGANVVSLDASAGSSSSDLYFDNDYSNATIYQVDLKTVTLAHGASIYIANETQVNSIGFWNSSTSSSTTFHGWSGAVFWVSPDSTVHWSEVYIQETVSIINNGKIILEYGSGYYNLRFNDWSKFSNAATLQADSGIYVEPYATFTNEQTGWIVSDIVNDPSTTQYTCYFSGTYTSVSGSDPVIYKYSIIENWGNFNCETLTFSSINVDNYGNISSPHFEFSSSSDYAFTYKKGAIIENDINWTSGTGYVIFEDNHWVENIQVTGASIYITSQGNTTIKRLNQTSSGSITYTTDPGQWIAFDGAVDVDGSQSYEFAYVTYTGVITSRGGGLSWDITQSTVIFTEKSTIIDEGDSSSAPYWDIYENGTLLFQGIVDVYSATVYVNDATAWWVNQGDWKSKSSISFNNYYSSNAGFGYNVGTMELTGGSIDGNFGLCKGGILTIRDRDTDTYFYPYITFSGTFASQGFLKFIVPSGFKDSVWDGSDQEVIYYYNDIEDWDAGDEISAYTTDDILSIPTLLSLCKPDSSSGYIYAYRSKKPTSCGSSGIGGGSPICSRPDLPSKSDPQGGTPGGPTSPSTSPTQPTTPSAVPTSPSTPTTVPTSPSTPTTVPTSPSTPTTVPTSPSTPSTPTTGPTSPTKPTPQPPKTPQSPTSVAGTFSFSVFVTLILGFILFIMF